MDLIDIHDLQIIRGEKIALEISSLSLSRGETLTVVGPNGAGKSTLLLALARLLKPARGDILYDGRSLRWWNELEYRRRISFVFQSPLLMDMSVEQNVALGLRFRGVPKAETRVRVAKWMEHLGVASLAKRRAGQLSGGEAQRVSLARAFVLEPELLLLDEPFAALDPPTHAKLLEDLSVLLKEDQRTAVFVTHNLREAATVGRRIAVIAGNRLRQVGAAKEIRNRPADETVAAFLRDLPQ